MAFRHSLRVTGSRFSLVYKSLIYIFIMLLIFTAITYSAVYPVIKPIIQGISDMQFFEHIGEAFRSIFSGNVEVQTSAFEQLRIDFDSIKEVFVANSHNVVWGMVLFVLFLIVCKFFITISRYPSSDVLNNFMNSNSRYGFVSNMIANLKKSVAYSVVETLVSLPYYALIALVVWGFGKLLIGVSFILCAMIILTFIILLATVKSSVLALWLPTYIYTDKGVFSSLLDSVKASRKIILYNIGMYFFMYFIAYAFTVLLGIVTFGIGFVFAISICRMFMISTELVLYYRLNDAKYYIDPETVIDSKTVISGSY